MAILIFQHHPLETPGRLGDRLRDLGHRLRIVQLHAGQPLPPDLDDVDGVVSMGGPMNVDEADRHAWLSGEMEMIREAHERDIPVVGICLGAQLIAKSLGGEVGPMEKGEATTAEGVEVGWHPVQLAFPGTMDVIHQGLPWRTMQFHLHGQEVKKLPLTDSTPLSGSQACKTQSFRVGLTTYGFQYHFEWTRKQIEAVLHDQSEWLRTRAIDAGTITSETDERYAVYRHLGDRLCDNITQLLMPLDKRVRPRRGEPAANFQPATS